MIDTYIRQDKNRRKLAENIFRFQEIKKENRKGKMEELDQKWFTFPEMTEQWGRMDDKGRLFVSMLFDAFVSATLSLQQASTPGLEFKDLDEHPERYSVERFEMSMHIDPSFFLEKMAWNPREFEWRFNQALEVLKECGLALDGKIPCTVREGYLNAKGAWLIYQVMQLVKKEELESGLLKGNMMRRKKIQDELEKCRALDEYISAQIKADPDGLILQKEAKKDLDSVLDDLCGLLEGMKDVLEEDAEYRPQYAYSVLKALNLYRTLLQGMLEVELEAE